MEFCMIRFLFLSIEKHQIYRFKNFFIKVSASPIWQKVSQSKTIEGKSHFDMKGTPLSTIQSSLPMVESDKWTLHSAVDWIIFFHQTFSTFQCKQDYEERNPDSLSIIFIMSVEFCTKYYSTELPNCKVTCNCRRRIMKDRLKSSWKFQLLNL